MAAEERRERAEIERKRNAEKAAANVSIQDRSVKLQRHNVNRS